MMSSTDRAEEAKCQPRARDARKTLEWFESESGQSCRFARATGLGGFRLKPEFVDRDGENTPSKKKILKMKCWLYLELNLPLDMLPVFNVNGYF